jgi:hypothetical protein
VQKVRPLLNKRGILRYDKKISNQKNIRQEKSKDKLMIK